MSGGPPGGYPMQGMPMPPGYPGIGYPGMPPPPPPGMLPPGYPMPPGYPGHPFLPAGKDKKEKKKDKDKKRRRREKSGSSSDRSSSSGKKKKKRKDKKTNEKSRKRSLSGNLDDSETAARAQAALRAAAAAAAVAGAKRRSASPLAEETGRKEQEAPPQQEDMEDQDLANRARGFMRPEKIEILQLPKSVIGRVIGKAGATIKDIRERTGARIDARDQTEDPVQVLLSGTLEACEHAKALILEVADGAMLTGDAREIGREAAAAAAAAAATAVSARASGGTDSNTPAVEEHIELPRHATGKVIGTKGQQIAEIRQKSGAQVDVDKSPTGCRVRFVGTQTQVDMAKAMIQAIMSPPPDTGNGDYLEIPRSAVGRIIGAGGARIQELQERSGAKIDIDRQPDRCLVRFGGFAESVQLAKTLVTEVLEGRDRTQLAEAAATMEIPPSATGRLIGPGGRQINEIQEKSGAKIDLDKGRDPCIVRMTGTSDAVAVAQVMIKEVLGSGSLQSLITTGHGQQDAVLSASVARAAAAAQAARAQVALSGRATAGGCAPRAIGGVSDEESIVFDIPLHLAEKVLGDGSWQKSVESKTGARVIVRRDALKCQLELCGQPEQVVEAESFCEETVRVIAAGMPPPQEKPLAERIPLALPPPPLAASSPCPSLMAASILPRPPSQGTPQGAPLTPWAKAGWDTARPSQLGTGRPVVVPPPAMVPRPPGPL